MVSLESRAYLEQIQWFPGGTTCPALWGLGRDLHFWGKPSQSRQTQPLDAVHHVKQVHGTQIIEASALTAPESTARPEADGLYTVSGSVPVAAKSADCLPLLFASKRSQFTCAVHAGWRGLTAGIIGAAVNTFRNLGGDAADLVCVIGPAIGVARYEIGDEVVAAVKGRNLNLTDEQVATALSSWARGNFHLNLVATAIFGLQNSGLQPGHVHAMQTCTFDDEAKWYSFRRSGKGCGGGTNVSAIGAISGSPASRNTA